MRLLLVRHGQTPSNVLRALDTGAPGPGLTELGLQQAAALVESLADERIGALFASNLHRARLTATPLAESLGLSIVVREGLREIAAGHLEMCADEDSIVRYHAVLESWMRGRFHEQLDGGEACSAVYERFNAVVAEAETLAATLTTESGRGVVRPDCGAEPTVAMVSHGAMIRTWCGHHATNVDADFAARNALANTGVVALTGSSAAGWTVETWAGERLG